MQKAAETGGLFNLVLCHQPERHPEEGRQRRLEGWPLSYLFLPARRRASSLTRVQSERINASFLARLQPLI